MKDSRKMVKNKKKWTTSIKMNILLPVTSYQSTQQLMKEIMNEGL